MIRQCAILFGCLALGELIVFLTGIKLPSSKSESFHIADFIMETIG